MVSIRSNNLPVSNRRPLILAALLLSPIVIAVGVYLYPSNRAPVASADAGPATAKLLAEESPEARTPIDAAASPIDAKRTAKADALLKEGELLQARNIYYEILEMSSNALMRANAKAALNHIHIQLAMTPRSMPEKVDYTVKSGDTLGALAKRFNTTVDLIKKSNSLESSLIRIGDRLRILQGTFSMQVSKKGRSY